ncbi:hypothetical protein [Actinoplanes sp. URMC 104]|uniref:hypothetical protein n=1 Tax=Actinoplanes sp. URMC 104 TaxID=3423409 RepID=UPI003F19C843
MAWYRNRYVGVAAILLTVSAGAAALSDRGAPEEDLQTSIANRMRATLEQSSPEQHQHAQHASTEQQAPPVVCGVRVYGHEPAGAADLAEVRTVYGFHLCGVAEQKRPWDVAVKLAGPVILDLTTDPVGIQVVEATEKVPFADRLRQMFPARYADAAQKEALTGTEMADLRRRYDAAAGL